MNKNPETPVQSKNLDSILEQIPTLKVFLDTHSSTLNEYGYPEIWCDLDLLFLGGPYFFAEKYDPIIPYWGDAFSFLSCIIYLVITKKIKTITKSSQPPTNIAELFLQVPTILFRNLGSLTISNINTDQTQNLEVAIADPEKEEEKSMQNHPSMIINNLLLLSVGLQDFNYEKMKHYIHILLRTPCWFQSSNLLDKKLDKFWDSYVKEFSEPLKYNAEFRYFLFTSLGVDILTHSKLGKYFLGSSMQISRAAHLKRNYLNNAKKQANSTSKQAAKSIES